MSKRNLNKPGWKSKDALAFWALAFALTIVSSCKLETAGNSYESLQSARLPLGIPSELQNSAWTYRDETQTNGCNYFMVFTLTSRVDAVECNGKVGFSEYRSGFLAETAQEATAGSARYQFSSEGLKNSSCKQNGSGTTANTFEQEGHSFWVALGSDTRAGATTRTMKTWTRKASNHVVYTEVDFRATQQRLEQASCF